MRMAERVGVVLSDFRLFSDFLCELLMPAAAPLNGQAVCATFAIAYVPLPILPP